MKDKYFNLTAIEIDNSLPETFVPRLDTSDYYSGNITRYFLQEAGNDKSPIFEVSENTYHLYNTNPYYKSVSLIWRITGNLEDKYEKEIYTPSVITSNRKSVENASKIMPSIRYYLVNLKQFWKPM